MKFVNDSKDVRDAKIILHSIDEALQRVVTKEMSARAVFSAIANVFLNACLSAQLEVEDIFELIRKGMKEKLEGCDKS